MQKANKGNYRQKERVLTIRQSLRELQKKTREEF